MPQKEKGEFEKLPGVRLYLGDRDRLEAYYPKAGYNRVIRRLVRQHLDRMDAKFEQRAAAKELNGETITRGDLEDE